MHLFNSLVLLSSLIVAKVYGQECVLRNKCECVFADGSGYNLGSVVSDDSFLEGITDQNLTFYFHPCGDTQKVPNDLPDGVQDNCKAGYSLCVYNHTTTGNKTTNVLSVLGKQTNMEFKMDGDVMQIIYISPETSEKKHSITLECTPNFKGSVLYAPSGITDQVHLQLFSKFACPTQIDEIHHHSFIYYLFIILLSLLFVYLVFGILINYFLIGARGYELIPNHDFWCKVWRSMKLAFWYAKNGGRVIPADDSYDAI